MLVVGIAISCYPVFVSVNLYMLSKLRLYTPLSISIGSSAFRFRVVTNEQA